MTMTDNTEPLPSEAAVAEALRRVGSEATPAIVLANVRTNPRNWPATILAAHLIEKHEPETLVDPDVLAADEYLAQAYEGVDCTPTYIAACRAGEHRDRPVHKAIVAAIKDTREKCRG